MDEKNLDRVVALDKFTIRTLKVRQAGNWLFLLCEYTLLLIFCTKHQCTLFHHIEHNDSKMSFMLTLKALQEKDMIKTKYFTVIMNIYFYRRVPCPRSPSPVEVVTPYMRWIQTKKVFAHWAQTTEKGGQNWEDTHFLRFSQSLMGKKRSKQIHLILFDISILMQT